jgi:hypothetical protein
MQVSAETQMDAVLDTLGGYNVTLEKQVQALKFVQENSQTLAKVLIGKSGMSTLTKAGLAVGGIGTTGFTAVKLLKTKGAGEAIKTMAKGKGKTAMIAKVLQMVGVGGAAVAPNLAKETLKRGVPAFTRMGTEVAEEAIKKAAPSVVGRVAGSVARGLPFIGLGLSMMDAFKAYQAGDNTGAMIALGGGAMSMIPGAGLARTALRLGGGFGAPMLNMGREMMGMTATADGAAPGTPGLVPSAATGAESATAAAQAAQAGAGFVAEEVVMPITLNIDGNEFVTAVGTANNVLFKQKQR